MDIKLTFILRNSQPKQFQIYAQLLCRYLCNDSVPWFIPEQIPVVYRLTDYCLIVYNSYVYNIHGHVKRL